MAEVVNALEGTVAPMQCFTDSGESRVLCNHEIDGYDHCATRLLWTRVQGGVTGPWSRRRSAELVEFAEHGGPPKRTKAARRARRNRPRRSPRHAGRMRRTNGKERMADLEIQNLHVDVEGKRDPQGRRPDRVPR